MHLRHYLMPLGAGVGVGLGIAPTGGSAAADTIGCRAQLG